MKQQILNSLIQFNQYCIVLRSRVRWSQRCGRGRKLLMTAVLALCIGVPAFAVVNDTFSDVPAAAFYHDAVNAIYRAGITAGCNTGLYCPDQAVTRGQMAVFMQRGLSRIAQSPGHTIPILANGFQDVATITINTGGAPGQTGFVKLDGTLDVYTSSTSGCPCEIEYEIDQDGTGALSGTKGVTIYNAYNASSLVHGRGSGAVTWALSVPTGTTQKFNLRARIRAGGAGAVIYGSGDLTAIYAPFGSMGTNNLAAQPSDDQELSSDQAQDKVSGKEPE